MSQYIKSYFRRAKGQLGTKQAFDYSALIIPLLFGSISLWWGQDANWDLRNYHWYNPYALLTHRLGTDLAPAGLQTYFNPLLDVPYFLMAQHWDARLVGFLMGFVQGLAYSVLLHLNYAALSNLPNASRYRTSMLLALGGTFSVGFLAEVGTTMGDSTTALLIILSLYLLISNIQILHGAVKQYLAIIFLAGLIAGFAVGLKLTNAVFAVALCGALFFTPHTWAARLRASLILGLGVLFGLAITNGYWFYTMWVQFRNPLFPQFSTLFPNPLTRSMAVADTRFLPKNLTEAAFWPIIFSVNPLRVSELRFWQVTWPTLYIGFTLFAFLRLTGAYAARRGIRPTPLPLEQRYVLAYVAIGFITWMAIFSIYRYIIALELVAPLAIWILAQQIFNASAGRRVAYAAIGLSFAIAVLGGTTNWGHAPWARRAFRIHPECRRPQMRSVIMLIGQPRAWLAPFFPADNTFIGTGTNLGMTPGYVQAARRLIEARQQNLYVIISAPSNSEPLMVEPGHSQDGNQNRREMAKVQNLLRIYGVSVIPQTCHLHLALIGRQRYPFQLCQARAGALGRHLRLGLSQ